MHWRMISSALITSLLLLTTAITTTAQTPNAVWTGEYYNNAALSGALEFSRTDRDISFDWGFSSPGNGLTNNEFSVRWSTDAYFEAGTYRFWALADDNIRITVDYSNTIIDTFATNLVDEVVSADVALNAGVHHIEVDYREVNSQAFAYVDFANLANNPTGPNFLPPVTPPANGAWTANYYANPDLLGSPTIVRGEMQPGGDWGSGSPFPAIPNDNWSARWTANLNLEGGEYRIRAVVDDGIRVYVDGAVVLNEWHPAAREEYVVTRAFGAGNHTFTVEYYEATAGAYLDFNLEQVSEPDGTTRATVTTGRLNVRATPDPIAGDILTQVINGQRFTALARTPDNSWIRINANGVIGWVNASYVYVPDIFSLPVVGSSTDGTQPTDYIVTATPYTVNIRTGPGTEYADIGNLPEGDTAQVIGRNANTTWWQINYDGITGWVVARYARIEAGADLSQIPVQAAPAN